MDMIFRRFQSQPRWLSLYHFSYQYRIFRNLNLKSAELLKTKFLLDEATTWLKFPMFPFRSFWVLGLVLLTLVS
jgi:hypothetical protein